MAKGLHFTRVGRGRGCYAPACTRQERQFIKLHQHTNGMKKKKEFVPYYLEAVVKQLWAHHTSFDHLLFTR